MEAEAKLESANIGLNNFAYMAAHDLQEPVRKVLLFANRLQTANEQSTGEEANVYIDKIVRASRRMRRYPYINFHKYWATQIIFLNYFLT